MEKQQGYLHLLLTGFEQNKNKPATCGERMEPYSIDSSDRHHRPNSPSALRTPKSVASPHEASTHPFEAAHGPRPKLNASRCLPVYFACAAGLIFAACTPQPVAEPEQAIQEQPIPEPAMERFAPGAELRYGSSSLASNIDLNSAGVRPAGQLKQVQVSVENLTGLRYQLEYKFNWYDGNGTSIESLGTWHRFTLTSRNTMAFSSIGKSPAAKQVVFIVRFPDDVFIDNAPAPPPTQQPPQSDNQAEEI